MCLVLIGVQVLPVVTACAGQQDRYTVPQNPQHQRRSGRGKREDRPGKRGVGWRKIKWNIGPL
jgi:hypothetical protein